MTHYSALPSTREACVAADAADPLRTFRHAFALPDGVIYLDGNSLGARPKAARDRALEVIEEEWGNDLIRSWNTHRWFELPTRVGDKVGALIGGGAGNTVVTDTTSINIFKVLAAALRVQQQDRPERRVIVSERENFPTDLYVAEGLMAFMNGAPEGGYELRLVDDEESLAAALTDDVAAVMLTHVNYRSGKMWDLDTVTADAQRIGALMVWDLCHSVGAVPVDLLAAGADFAVGCTYKYLNGGPGSPAFLWVAPQHQARAENPLSGWWGHARPFAMEAEYAAGHGIERFKVGTQSVIALAVAEIGIDLMLQADQGIVRAKSLALTTLFMQLVRERLAAHPLTLITPETEHNRGSHVSVRHPEGFAVVKALIAAGIIGDYREPEVMRFGFTPLYTSFTEVWDAVEALREILESGSWNAPEFQLRGAVT